MGDDDLARLTFGRNAELWRINYGWFRQKLENRQGFHINEQTGETREVTRQLGHAVEFMPHVAPHFRGLTITANLHLSAPMLLVQAALPEMRRRRFGRIVLVSSRAALGLATRTAYATTKAGMFGMARTWALELGRDGITANVVEPGPIVTDMFHEVIPRERAALEATAAKIPVGRLGLPEDVARAVMFFVAPESGFVTGQSLYVCGGTSVGSITY